MVEKDVFDSSLLELTTYEEFNENWFFPKELDIIHQLLLFKLNTSPFSEATMLDLTTIVEFLKGHNLHSNHKLPPK